MQIGVIGCGTMGTLLARHFVKTQSVTLYGRNAKKTQALATELDTEVAESLPDLLKNCDVIFLCVKPSQLDAVLESAGSAWTKDHLVISILAGISTAELGAACKPARVMRLMPNTPMSIGEGVLGLEESQLHSTEDRGIAAEVLSGLGHLHWVSEAQMPAFTALAGCGPGFVFTMLEALIDGAVALGLKADLAREVASQMMVGSALLTMQSDKGMAELRWDVCSPGGSTIAGVQKLESHGVRAALMSALSASYSKS